MPLMSVESPGKKFNFNIEDPQILPPDTINIPNNVISASQGPSENVTKVERICRIICWTSIPVCLIQLLFILPMAYPLLVTIICPIVGLIAARKYNEYFLKLYASYLILLIFIQFLAMIILQGTAYIVLQSLFILFELFVSINAIRVAYLMSKLTNQEWINLQAN